MSVQLFAQMQGSTEYVNLALFDSDPVKLSLSVTNIQDPLAATSVFSKTFRVPHNSINGKYFKGVFNINSTDFDSAVKSDAYILDNGQLFTRGNIRLINVYNSNSENSVEYEILFTGETSDFGAKIGGGFLNEIDFTEYNHERTLINIQKSWDNNLFAGDLVYGLIEWGYIYDKNNRPSIPTLSNGFEKSFTNSANPLDNSQWKPQFRAKAIWDKVFSNVGYTYDSDFLNSELFKKMYVITENKAEAVGANNTGVEATKSGVQYQTIGSTFQLNFQNEINDPGNNYDPGTSVYTIPATGTYTATVRLDVGLGHASSWDSFSVGGSISVVDSISNTTLANQGFYISGNTQNITATLNFAGSPGQKVVIKIDSQCVTGSGCTNGSTDIRFYSGTLIYTTQSNIFSINSILPNNVRTIDFMRSIINRFRLVFVPSKEIENHFTITPWKDWILQGEAIDWTNKINGNIDSKDSPIFYSQNRFNIFKDQEDSDYLNYDYQLQYKQTFGQLNLDSANELITGTKTYQDQFAAAPLAPIGFKENDAEAPKFVIPHIAKDTGASQDSTTGAPIVGKREAVQPKLRLVFYNGLRQAPLTWYTKDYAGGPVAMTTYPLMSQYSEFPVTPSTFDLCWANVPPYWDVQIPSLGSGKTSNTNFNVFWKSWYDTTFDPYSRLSEVEVQLDYSDLINFKFNNYVFIENSWYFVNEVKDYIVGQNSLCKVQLIKVGNNLGITLPIVESNKLTQITLCKGTTACEAYCCKSYTGAQSNTYWIDGTDLSDSISIYIDNAGNQFAPAGIYSDGMTAMEINGSGNIIARPDISACDCTPTTYTYTAEKVTTTPCDLYCKTNATVVVYSTSNTFLDSAYLFLDNALTIPAPAAYYAIVGASNALQVGTNGQVLVTVSLVDCNCITYYDHVVCYSGALCDACCCYNTPVTVYTNNASLSQSTLIWNDNAGVTPAPIGYYKESSGAVARVSTAGVIAAIDNCFDCPACDAGPVQVTFGIGGSEPGYTSTATLEKSFDNVTWIEVGTLTFTSGGDVQDTVGLEEGVYVRATFTSTVNNGDLYSYYYVNGQTVFYNINDTPGSKTIYSTGTITAANLYQLSGYISGGDPAPVATDIIVTGVFNQYKSQGFPITGGGLFGGIADLQTSNAAVNTSFNVGQGGFTYAPYGGPGYIVGVATTQNNVYVCGYFDKYKNVAQPVGIAKLDYTGVIDPVFKTNIGTALGTGQFVNDILVYQNKVYLAGSFTTFNGSTANSIVRLDLNGNVDTSFTSPFTAGTDIKKIYGYNNQIYVLLAGKGSAVRLNQNGSIDTSFITVNAANLTGSTATFYNNNIYVGVFNSTFNTAFVSAFDAITGTTIPTGYAIPVFTDSINNSAKVSSIVVDSTGMWVGGKFNSILISSGGGTFTRQNLAKFNLNGSLNTAFTANMDKQGGVTSEVNQILLDSTGLYVAGDYNRVNGSTAFPCIDLVKVNRTTGSAITSFATSYSFTPTNAAAAYDIAFKPVPVPLLPLNTFKSTNSACEAYCGTPNNLIYLNNTTLNNSTILYQNSNGTIPVTQGWYSDGISIVYVLANDGVITDRPSASGCNCNPLNQYSLNYNSGSACLSCSSGASAVGWISEPNWGSATLVYGDSNGSTFVTPGFYNSNLGTINQVGSNGVVISQSDCIDCNLDPNCAEYQIINYGSQTFNYSYVDCSGFYHSGTLYAGTGITTQCMNLQDFSANGSTWQVTSSHVC